jgi:Cu+-exporting ATPase
MYIKNSSVIEKITKIDTIVFDKTGTITTPDKSNIGFVGEELTEEDLIYAVSLAKQSTHPFSSEIAKRYSNLSSLPTSGYIEVEGRGIYAVVNSRKIKLGSSEYVAPERVPETTTVSSVYFSIDNNVLGYFTISNSYRRGFEDVVNSLSKEYKLFLLSGDNESERSYLEKFFDADKMYFNRSPLEKKEFISSLQADGCNVLMTGDGLNDSGAFIKSDVALSIADDIYHFSPAGDAIIDAAKFHRLPEFINYCNRSLGILKSSFAISLIYNIAGLSFALSGNLSPVVAAILMPVSSVSVVIFATVATRLLAVRAIPPQKI